MRLVTTTLCYPTPAEPDQGIFVQRRAVAVSQNAGVDVRVISPQLWCPGLRPGRSFPDQASPLPATYPRMLSIPVLSWVCDGLAYARALERALVEEQQRTRQRFDLIDAHFEYPDGVGAWLAGRRLSIPVAVTVRGKIVSLSRRAIRRMQIAAMLRGVDARIAVSESLAGWVRTIGGSDLAVDVIPNGIDETVFHPMAQACAKSMLGWDPNVRYLLAVGHLQKLKGFDRLVEVMPAIRNALGDVRLILAGSRRGEPRFRDELAQAIERVNAVDTRPDQSPCVQFVGPVSGERLNLMYNAANLFVNASRSEGWNNAISEALATGTPVVATDVGGNREQIRSDDLGATVPDDNPAALKEAIISALLRTWNRETIATHGGQRTNHIVADEVLAVFNRILSLRSTSRPADERPATKNERSACVASTAEVPA